MEQTGIELDGLTKMYGSLCAVDHIDLQVRRGSLFGFLGPNGAGKSTTISMLSTILSPTEGTARIHNLDVHNQRSKVREIIGVCPQEIVMWDLLTARENLHLIAQMHNLHPGDYKERADELLAQMNLLERGNDKTKVFSGGMKRRLNVLMAVIHDPDVIFFDEPSAGLDPQSRRVVWDYVKNLEKEKKTVLLTTHNMEEADDLCEELIILDNGKIIARGTPKGLKGQLGKGDIVEFKVDATHNRAKIIKRLENLDFINWAKTLGKSRITTNGRDSLRRISDIIDAVGVKMRDIAIRKNTLEDVFISLTGRELRN